MGRLRPELAPAGLSPRVRGNPVKGDRGGFRLGSIPACAGEPSATSRSASVSQVYPRVCGGTQRLPIPPLCRHGLSPRVRGNHPLARRAAGRAGSIPACAGEPASGGVIAYGGQVYPRVCGGTDTAFAPARPTTGLSPRVRGNLAGGVTRHFRVRSIPACAGEPGTRSNRCRVNRVYPRVCGGTIIPLDFE